MSKTAGVVDHRAGRVMGDADTKVAAVWRQITALAAAELPGMGLTAGERPTADVEVLAGAFAALEYELARRMHAAAQSDSLPLLGAGALLAARGWAPWHARRLARAGQLAAEHPSVSAAWAAGLITADHVDAIARHSRALSQAELSIVIEEMADHWGSWTPHDVARFVAAAGRLLHPPADDPGPAEQSAHESRDLSFALLGDSVLLSGALPRLEGEAVIAAIEAWAERLRSTAEHTAAGARRADALVELVNQAAASASLPTRGGLPVALTVSLEATSVGDPVWSTSRGHHLSPGEARFVACDPTLTPVAVHGVGSAAGDAPLGERTPAARVAALADLMLSEARLPLAVGRSTRIATVAQRRALASRDRGCIMPGCEIPAENCQTHHVDAWARGAATGLDNLVLLCWTHHRQVDLGRWSIEARPPDRRSAHPEPPAISLATPGIPWPANHGAPWTIMRKPRNRWLAPDLR